MHFSISLDAKQNKIHLNIQNFTHFSCKQPLSLLKSRALPLQTKLLPKWFKSLEDNSPSFQKKEQ